MRRPAGGRTPWCGNVFSGTLTLDRSAEYSDRCSDVSPGHTLPIALSALPAYIPPPGRRAKIMVSLPCSTGRLTSRGSQGSMFSRLGWKCSSPNSLPMCRWQTDPRTCGSAYMLSEFFPWLLRPGQADVSRQRFCIVTLEGATCVVRSAIYRWACQICVLTFSARITPDSNRAASDYSAKCKRCWKTSNQKLPLLLPSLVLIGGPSSLNKKEGWVGERCAYICHP